MATAGFTHQGEHKEFTYSYLPGTHLLHTLTHPNGLTLTQSYEQLRDLPTQMDYTRADALIVRRGYTYDILGRPTTRDLARYGTETQDTFGYNNRSALSISDQKGSQKLYGYDFVNLASSFVKSPIIKFTTCHSASHPICGGNSLIEDVYAGLQGYIYGYDGRADYAPVASGRPPMRGTSIDETKAIIDNKLIITGEKALPRQTPYKVYSIRIPREQK